MAEFKSYDDLSAVVKDQEGVLTCEMWQLRDIHGAGKLGVHVVANISSELAKRGLGHFPNELPQNQYDRARIYQRGSRVGEIISAATLVSEEADATLRSASADDATGIVEKIRELVCG